MRGWMMSMALLVIGFLCLACEASARGPSGVGRFRGNSRQDVRRGENIRRLELARDRRFDFDRRQNFNRRPSLRLGLRAADVQTFTDVDGNVFIIDAAGNVRLVARGPGRDVLRLRRLRIGF